MTKEKEKFGYIKLLLNNITPGYGSYHGQHEIFRSFSRQY